MATLASNTITLAQVNDGADGKMLYATSSTDEATADKTAQLVAGGTLMLSEGLSVSVRFEYGNVAANPTLDLNGTGAKPIYTQGAPYAYWQAGATVVFVYDGSSWRTASEPVYADTVLVGSKAGKNVYIDDNGVAIKENDNVLASFEGEEINLGNESDAAVIHMCDDQFKLSTDYQANDYGESTVWGHISAKNNLGIAAGENTSGTVSDGNINIFSTQSIDLQSKYIYIAATKGAFTIDITNSALIVNAVSGIEINGYPLADFPIEIGENSNWRWKKYKSGYAEMWGRKSGTHSGVTPFPIPLEFPFNFTEKPYAFVTFRVAGRPDTHAGYCNAALGGIDAYGLYGNTVGLAYEATYYAYGKYK